MGKQKHLEVRITLLDWDFFFLRVFVFMCLISFAVGAIAVFASLNDGY